MFKSHRVDLFQTANPTYQNFAHHFVDRHVFQRFK